MVTALMGTGSWNAAMLGVAEQAGFRVAYRLLWYTKAIA